eukprot:COSAG03_NODE_920_length_5316_cov_6.634848_9_plen_121_part_00
MVHNHLTNPFSGCYYISSGHDSREGGAEPLTSLHFEGPWDRPAGAGEHAWYPLSLFFFFFSLSLFLSLSLCLHKFAVPLPVSSQPSDPSTFVAARGRTDDLLGQPGTLAMWPGPRERTRE